jgi:PAS domain S-box-containing protein
MNKPRPKTSTGKKAAPGDSKKTKAQLIEELGRLRRRNIRLEKKSEKLKADAERLSVSSRILEEVSYTTDFLLAYLDSEFNFIHVNQAYADAGRKSRDYFIGKNHFDLYPHEENEAIFRRVVQTGESFSISAKPFDHPDQPERGTTYWDWTLSPIKDKSGGVEGLVFSLHDVTDRIRAEVTMKSNEVLNKVLEEKDLLEESLRKSEEKWRSFVESAPDIIFVVNREGIISYINSAPEGITAQEAIGTNVYDYVPKEYHDTLSRALERVFLNGEKESFEILARGPNDVPAWYTTRVGPIRRDDRVVEAILITSDITERKQLEEELQSYRNHLEYLLKEHSMALMESEKNLRKAQEVSHLGHWRLDPQTMSVEASDELLDIFGLSREETTLDAFAERVHPEDREYHLSHIRRGMQQGEPWNIEHRLLMKDGTIKWVNAIGEAESDKQGKVKFLVGTVQDINDRKNSEAKLIESENRLRQAQQIAKLGFWDWNITTDELYWSDETFKMFGLEPQKLTPTYEMFMKIIHPDDMQYVQEYINASMRDDAPYNISFRYIRPSGEIGYLHSQGEVTRDNRGKPVQFMGIQVDITEQKLANMKLKAHAVIFDNLAEGIYLVGRDDFIIKWANPLFETMFGYEPGEMIGKPVDIVNAPTEMTPEETRNSIVQMIEEAGQWHGEVRNIRKDGTHFWCHANVSLLDHPEYGRVFVTVHRDITERKRAEEELRAQAIIFDNLAEGIYLIGLDDLIIKWTNPVFERMFGYEPGEMIGKPVDIVNAPTEMTPEETSNSIGRILEETGEWHGEVQNIRKDGTHFWCHANVSLLDHPEYGRVFVSVHSDITEHKRTEKEIMSYKDKLAALAWKLSSTEERERRDIAGDLHDHIGQNLAMVKILLGKLKGSIPAGARPDLDRLEDILRQVIQDTRTLTFEISPPVLYDLGLVDALEWLAENEFKKHGIFVEIQSGGMRTHLNNNVRMVLYKAIRELLNNIMKHSGVLKARVLIDENEDGINIMVEDKGRGIDTAGIKADAVDSLKFGLFSIRERIAHIGGEFIIDSTPGYGTRVTLTVPAEQMDDRT